MTSYSGVFKNIPLDISNTYIHSDVSGQKILIGETSDHSNVDDNEILIYNEGKTKLTNHVEIIGDVSFNKDFPDKVVDIGCNLTVKNLTLKYSDISYDVDNIFFDDLYDTGVVDTLLFINSDGEVRSTGIPYTKLQYANQIGFENDMITILKEDEFSVLNEYDVDNVDYSYSFIVRKDGTQSTYSKVGINFDNPRVTLDLSGSTDAIQIPVGTESQRPSDSIVTMGMIRYNTTTSQYEGYGGTAWQGLGGVIDIDKDTYISAENNPTDDNDELKFYTDGTQRMVIDNTGNIGIIMDAPRVILDLSGATDAIQIPVGTESQRPSDSIVTTGMIRYNTTTSQYEGYGGAEWQGLGGVTDIDKDTYISAENNPNDDNDELKFYTDGTQRMVIDNTGNVGILMNDPRVILDLSEQLMQFKYLLVQNHKDHLIV